MEQGQLNWIANFIWGIADDVLRDLYVRGKYRDVILPMTVLRRLDAVLEPTKQAVGQDMHWPAKKVKLLLAQLGEKEGTATDNRAEILPFGEETEGLLVEIVGGAA
jgi:type I restriction enzyme M protein